MNLCGQDKDTYEVFMGQTLEAVVNASDNFQVHDSFRDTLCYVSCVMCHKIVMCHALCVIKLCVMCHKSVMCHVLCVIKLCYVS
jgi:hypothetical protein